MEHIDQAEQSRRLSELYAEMSDGQLRVMAAGFSGLTEVAQRSLRAEFSRRGLELEPEDVSIHQLPPDENELVDCYRAGDFFEARLVMNILASAGIRSCLFGQFGENFQRLVKTQDTGGTIKVTRSDAKHAFEIIDLYFPQEAQEKAKYDARCPKCHSTEVVLQGLEPMSSKNIPSPRKVHWTCGDCGHEWKEEGDDA